MIFQLFKYLKNNKIKFALTNGYKDVFSKKDTEADIDMLFRKNDFKNIEVILQKFCFQHDLKFVQVLHHDLWAKNIFLFNPKTLEFLNLDIYAELSRKGILFFEEDEVFNSLDEFESIPIISAEKEFISYLYKKIEKNDLTQENFSHLNYLYQKETLCEKQLKNIFPANYQFIVEAFTKNNIDTILLHRQELIDEASQNKYFNILSYIKNKLRIIKRVFHPTGISISFLGPDGSGKSTIINGVQSARLPFRRKDYFHLKPIAVTNSIVTVQTDPHQYPVYSKLKSYLKIMFFIFQYNKGWIKTIIPLKIRSSLVIFDRYFDDLLADQKRYRYGGGLWLIKSAKIFIPKPEIYFILTTDPKVIYDRKQEVEFTELERQVKEYEKLVDNTRHYRIDVQKTPTEIRDEVVNIIMNKMSERYLKYR